MSGFKLLAIRPLEGCNEKYRKNLIPGQIYQFYQDYQFEISEDENGKEVVSVKPLEEDNIPSDLYSIKRENKPDLDINISAIVGKNGSGKSTLFDLFFASLFIASMDHGILEYHTENYVDEIEKHEKKIEQIKKKNDRKSTEIKRKINRFLRNKKREVDLDKTEIEQLYKEYFDLQEENEVSIKSIKSDIFWIKHLIEQHKKLKEECFVEVFFEIDQSVYSIKTNDFEAKSDLSFLYPNSTKKKGDFDSNRKLKNWRKIDKYFCYSIAISYSHYALNAFQTGSWINALFHKNDGYQAPIVINPMRINGNIDINIENDLIHQRLLSILLEPISDKDPIENSSRKLVEGKIAHTLELRLKEVKTQSSEVKISSDFLNELCLQYVGSNAIFDHFEPVVILTKHYIERKIIRICEKYDRYKRFIVNQRFKGDNSLISMLCKDNSHITFKLKQALNFLILDHYPITDYRKSYSNSINAFSNFIVDAKIKAKEFGKKRSTIELLPPAFFDLQIKFEDGSNFLDLSSGEKQSIYSISSIIYHIINVNSVQNNGERKTESKVKLLNYPYLNILFDEVELYFHPDLQRKFIFDLRSAIERVNPSNIDNILGINILFATHSPFILSDIPSNNVLKIINGQCYDHTKESFGANIYDLLADDFYMKEGFIGKYVMSKISEVIAYINNEDYSSEKQYKATKLALLVGDEIISSKLLKLLDEKADKFNKNNPKLIELENQKRIIEEQIKQLRKR